MQKAESTWTTSIPPRSVTGMTKPRITRSLVVFLVSTGIFILPFRATSAQAGTVARADADRVLVLRNANSPVSRSVADDYAKRRGINQNPTIACPDAAVDHNT